MTQGTRNVIKAAIGADCTMSKSERDGIMAILSGDFGLGVGRDAVIGTMTQTEAARRLGISSRTVRNLVRRGELRCAGGGKKGRITLQSLKDYAG